MSKRGKNIERLITAVIREINVKFAKTFIAIVLETLLQQLVYYFF